MDPDRDSLPARSNSRHASRPRRLAIAGFPRRRVVASAPLNRARAMGITAGPTRVACVSSDPYSAARREFDAYYPLDGHPAGVAGLAGVSGDTAARAGALLDRDDPVVHAAARRDDAYGLADGPADQGPPDR